MAWIHPKDSLEMGRGAFKTQGLIMFKWQLFIQDNIGKKFGDWVIIRYVGKRRSIHLIECQCSCGVIMQRDLIPFRNGTHSTRCNSCSRSDTCFADKQFKSVYSHPSKMHASEEDEILDYFNDFSHRYYRDDND